MSKIHFIAIGGAAMHNLAIALHLQGEEVSGSDDQIFDPSKSRLEKYGLLPPAFGWFEEKISEDLDVVILGMHARADNPELLKAKALGLKIFSYPEYLYEASKNKKRVVIGGSHGKTSVTSMVLHVLQQLNIACDYMVGAQLEGFECMVKMSDAPIMVIEGDEYLTSPLDLRPKFHHYKPHIAVLTGIAWDHINVFPTYENYLQQFEIFIDSISDYLTYFEGDKDLKELCVKAPQELNVVSYQGLSHYLKDDQQYVEYEGQEYEMKVFGSHNFQNMNAALNVLMALGVSASDALSSLATFTGASNRLEEIYHQQDMTVYKDFAHAPSKLKATIKSVRERYPNQKIFAFMELHTFSSLNKEFFSHYKGAMEGADDKYLYYNPKTVAAKKLPEIAPEEIFEAFGHDDMKVLTETSRVQDYLDQHFKEAGVLLWMSSGDFGGIDIRSYVKNKA